MRIFFHSVWYRNEVLVKEKGFKAPTTLKTGTTIAGVVFKGGVVLGADTRATEGPIVADKFCEKIHFLADNIRCCGAGTAADTEFTTDLIASQIKLHVMGSQKKPRVATACTLLKRMLFRYGGNISAALVLGGVDCKGSHLFSIHPHGSVDELSYTTMGSGSLAAMAIFEVGWHEDMEEEEAKKLVHDAISAGIFNDLGSGSSVDLCVIREDGTEYFRGYSHPNGFRGTDKKTSKEYTYPRGTTPVLRTQVQDIRRLVEVVDGGNAGPSSLAM